MAVDRTIYKQISLEAAKSRTLKPLSSDKKTKVNTIIGKFITYLKAAHS